MAWCAFHLTAIPGWESECSVKIYKKTHSNHPMTIWVRTSPANFLWTIRHGLFLCREYTKRYSRRHACQDILEWMIVNHHVPLCNHTVDSSKKTVYRKGPMGCTPVPLCHPYHMATLVESYRKYYLEGKSTITVWKFGRPKWA